MMFNVNDEDDDDEKAEEKRIQKVANKISNIFVVLNKTLVNVRRN